MASAKAMCDLCAVRRPMILRPRTGERACRQCFIAAFEEEVHCTIVENAIFRRGDKVAVAASGGKDSTVLAHLLSTLNARHGYGLQLVLLSVDEGIAGYRDASLETVAANRDDLGLPLTVVTYAQLYGYSMDDVVRLTGARNNCTFCGVFRRQALDRGARLVGADVIATGHNVDDLAETVLMNLLRGDVARLGRCAAISSPRPSPAATAAVGTELPATGYALPRVKPLKWAYEKEIVLYAHARGLGYHSTECSYSPNAYRGFAREWIKELEAIRPATLIDIVASAEIWRVDEGEGGSGGGDEEDDDAPAGPGSLPAPRFGCGGAAGAGGAARTVASAATSVTSSKLTMRTRVQRPCSRCGFLASTAVCQACALLASLATGTPRLALTTARHARKLYGAEAGARGELAPAQLRVEDADAGNDPG